MNDKYIVVEHPQVPEHYIILGQEDKIYVGTMDTDPRSLHIRCNIKNNKVKLDEKDYFNYLAEV